MASNVVYLFHPMTDAPTEHPNRVRELRKAKGMTLEALAAKVGLSTQMVGFIERGLRDMKHSQQIKLAEALGVAADEILLQRHVKNVLTQDEEALIASYRALDARGRNMIRNVAQQEMAYRAEEVAQDNVATRKAG